MGDSLNLMEVNDDVGLSSGAILNLKIKLEKKDEKYQQEKHLLKYLPYYDQLQNESEKWLEKIIVNLSKALLCQDFELGVDIYTKELRSYITMFGRKFSKDQHINLVNLFLETLTSKTYPINLIPEIAQTLNTLLSKTELLTRDDLSISWRPLYKTLDRCVFHTKYELTLEFISNIQNLLEETIRHANVYFEKNTASEVISEFTPIICPSSFAMSKGLKMLRLFLPFGDPQAEETINELLIHLIGIYDGCNNHPHWEWDMIRLFGVAAKYMHGSFDWSPHLPMMYSRFVKNLGQSDNSCFAMMDAFQNSQAAEWIVSTLGNNSVALKHLCNFLKTLEPFYNRTNSGSWTNSLEELLDELVRLFTLRLKQERYTDHKNKWWWRISDQFKLTDEDIDIFVKITSSIVLEFYLGNESLSHVLRYLAFIRPQIIIPAVMEKYDGIVETLTESNKYIIVLQWINAILLPMVSCRKDVEGYDGRKLVIPFVQSLLPAIDPNDMLKTLWALACLYEAFNFVPIVDSSSLSNTIEDKDDRELCIQTACIEDFIMQFLDRILSLLEVKSVENTRMADTTTAYEDADEDECNLEGYIFAVFLRIGTESSTRICERVVQKIVSFALERTLETEVSARHFTSILQAFVVVRSDIILPRLLSPLCSAIKSHITDDMLDDEDLDKTLVFQMSLLTHIMHSPGSELLKFKEDIESVLTAVLKLNGKIAYKLASNILFNFFRNLLHTSPVESRISGADYDNPNYLAINDWGVAADPKTINIKWNIPSDEEVEWAKHIFLKVFQEFSSNLKPAKKLTEKNDEFNKRLLKNLRILVSAYQGMSTILRIWNDNPIISEETIVDIYPHQFHYGLVTTDSIYEPGTDKHITYQYFQIYSEVFEYLKKFKADDTDAFIELVQGYHSLIISETTTHSISSRSWNPFDPKKKYTRGGIIAKAYDLHSKKIMRHVNLNSRYWTESHVQVMHKLFQLCINRYAMVRINAQNKFHNVLGIFEGLSCRSISNFFEDFLKPGVPHDEFKGALYTMLGEGSVSPLLQNSWGQIHKLWLALVHSPFSEKQSIIQRMDTLNEFVIPSHIYCPVQSKSSCFHSKSPHLANVLLSKSNLDIVGPLRKSLYAENTKIVMDLLNCLTEIASDGNVHWRRQEMCLHMLRRFIIDDEAVPITRQMIEVFFESLISHSIDVRKTAIQTLPWLLKVFKREYPSTDINPNNVIFSKGESIHALLHYKLKLEKNSKWTIPTNSHSSNIFIHKTHHGFAGLPSKLTIKLPLKDFSDISTGQSEAQKLVLETTQKYFRDEVYIKKLLDIWSLEEVEDYKRMIVCQYITRDQGPLGIKLRNVLRIFFAE